MVKNNLWNIGRSHKTEVGILDLYVSMGSISLHFLNWLLNCKSVGTSNFLLWQCFEKPYALAWSPLEINYRNRFRYQILVEFFLLSTLPYKATMNFLCSLRDEQSTVDSSQPRLRAMSSRCRTRVYKIVGFKHTVKLQAVDRSTIQFWTTLGVLLNEFNNKKHWVAKALAC